MTKIIRVNPGQFSKDGLRAGDLIALANFLEYVRKELNDPDIKMWFPEGSLHPNKHVLIMHNYICNYTDYFLPISEDIDVKPVNVCIKPGSDPTYPDLINLWNIREDVTTKRQDVIHIPDAVKIKACSVKQDVIVVAPVLDAPYNVSRNWPLERLKHILNSFTNMATLLQYKKILAIKEPFDKVFLDISKYGFQYEFSYGVTLLEISRCKYFVGGDSGLSHFAAAQYPRIPFQEYWYPNDTYGTTLPFYWNDEDPFNHSSRTINYY